LPVYLQPLLDVLFVALNPPGQSAANGHWFSGKQSRFFALLFKSGLITVDLPKATADEFVFGDTQFNYKFARFGVTDLKPHHVEVDSRKVKLTDQEIEHFIRNICENRPRIVCIIHSKVSDAFNEYARRNAPEVGTVAVAKFTQPLQNCPTRFICNYFPNGNSVPDKTKIDIFVSVRRAI